MKKTANKTKREGKSTTHIKKPNKSNKSNKSKRATNKPTRNSKTFKKTYLSKKQRALKQLQNAIKNHILNIIRAHKTKRKQAGGNSCSQELVGGGWLGVSRDPEVTLAGDPVHQRGTQTKSGKSETETLEDIAASIRKFFMELYEMIASMFRSSNKKTNSTSPADAEEVALALERAKKVGATNEELTKLAISADNDIGSTTDGNKSISL